MSSFLMALENTALSQWVLGSIYGYGVILTFHSLGLGLLVGLLLVIALRLLGFLEDLALPPLARFLPFVWIGFVCNAVSGVILFMADAQKNFYSGTFWIKMLAIAVGLAFALHLKRTALRSPAADGVPTPATRALAAASIVAWIVAVIAGRLLAYVDYVGGLEP